MAKSYDNFPRGDEEAAVAFLADLAGDGGSPLELAIGTGRIALPLAARGVRVDGIDLSEAMIDRCEKRPGGDKIAVTVGDFAEVPVPDGAYRLDLRRVQHDVQPADPGRPGCVLQNVAAHLEPRGAFVIEAGSPAVLYGMRENQYVQAEAIEVDHVRLDLLGSIL